MSILFIIKLYREESANLSILYKYNRKRGDNTHMDTLMLVLSVIFAIYFAVAAVVQIKKAQRGWAIMSIICTAIWIVNVALRFSRIV